MRSFSILSRTRPQAMSGVAAINPVTILDLAERLQWPCEAEEALTVIMHIDDEYRQMHQQKAA